MIVAGVGLQILGQASGVNTVIYYAPKIFESSGLGSSSSILATVGVGVVNLVMTPVGMVTVDRIGRTKLLALGAFTMTLALAGLAATLSGRRPALLGRLARRRVRDPLHRRGRHHAQRGGLHHPLGAVPAAHPRHGDERHDVLQLDDELPGVPDLPHHCSTPSAERARSPCTRRCAPC
nr:MFS transporter [Streptomyces hygroscopicus]